MHSQRPDGQSWTQNPRDLTGKCVFCNALKGVAHKPGCVGALPPGPGAEIALGESHRK